MVRFLCSPVKIYSVPREAYHFNHVFKSLSCEETGDCKDNLHFLNGRLWLLVPNSGIMAREEPPKNSLRARAKKPKTVGKRKTKKKAVKKPRKVRETLTPFRINLCLSL